MMKKLITGLFVSGLFTVAAFGAAEPLRLQEENAFFRKQVDFASPAEKAEEKRLLAPPAEKLGFTKTTFSYINDLPVITHNNKRLTPVNYAIMHGSNGNLVSARRLRESGINFFMIDVAIVDFMYRRPRNADTEKMYKRFAANAKALLQNNPDASFMIRIWASHEGDDYQKLYPDHLLAEPDGNTLWRNKDRHANYMEKWKLYVGKKVRDFLIRVGKSPYAPHVTGVFIGAMHTGEWWFFKDGRFVWDYSKGRKDLFKQYLLWKYGKKNFPSLMKEWKAKDEKDLFRLPTPAERRVGRNNYPNSRVGDYLQILNLPVTDAACFFAKIIKSVSNGRLLAGMEILSELNTMNCNGTVFIRHLLRCKELDFLGAPSPYHLRGPGRFSPERAVLRSIRHHGKFFFSEDDTRTHLTYGTRAGHGSPPATPGETVHVLRRQALSAFMKGHLLYLMEFSGGWFVHPLYREEFRKHIALWDLMLQEKGGRNPEIAIVSDQESQLYCNYFSNPTYLRLNSLPYLGADYDYYELEDFLQKKVYSKYKLVIFLNLSALSEEEMAKLDALKSGNRTLLFLGAAGRWNLTRKRKDWTKDLSRITSINMERGAKRKPSSGRLKIRCNKAAFKKVFGEALSFTTEAAAPINKNAVSPADFVDLENMYAGNDVVNVVVRDPKAVALGQSADSLTRFAVKKFPNWTSYYSGSMELPAPVLRAIALKAGCHITSREGHIVFARKPFTALHTAKAGKVTLHFAGKLPILELFSGKIHTPKNGKIRFTAKRGETFLFIEKKDPGKFLARFRSGYKALEKEQKVYSQKYKAPKANAGYWGYVLRNRHIAKGKNGPYKITVFAPPAMLLAGPYNASAKLEIKKFTEKLPERAAKEVKAPAVSNLLDRLGAPLKGLPSLTPGKGIFWSARKTGIWNDLASLGIGKGQKGVFAFYLQTAKEKEMEIFFACDGKGKLIFDRKKLKASKGLFGELVQLSPGKNLFLVEAENLSGINGFCVKISEKVNYNKSAKAPRPLRQAQGITLWITP